MDSKPVMGDQTPRTARAIDDAWKSLPTSDHRLGYMISFAQGLEIELASAMEYGHKHRLEAVLAKQTPAPEERAWMPVSQPPEASGWVLAWFQEQHSILLFDKQQGWYWGDGEHVMEKGYVKDITHWMPLPDGPLPQNRSTE